MVYLQELIKRIKQQYDDDVMLQVELGYELMSNEKLDGEYKMLKIAERYFDEIVKKEEETMKEYKGGITD